ECHVCRPDCRTGRCLRSVRPSHAPLYPRTSRLDPEGNGKADDASAAQHLRHRARSGEAAGRLPLLAPLRACHADLSAKGAGADPTGRGAQGAMRAARDAGRDTAGGGVLSEPLISARDLTKHYRVGGGLGGQARFVRAVDGVSLDIYERETFALVGESGCGKTTLGRVMLRLQEATSGAVLYRGLDLGAQGDATMRALRKKLQIVFQDPYASLNPRMRIEA